MKYPGEKCVYCGVILFTAAAAMFHHEIFHPDKRIDHTHAETYNTSVSSNPTLYTSTITLSASPSPSPSSSPSQEGERGQVHLSEKTDRF